MNEEKEMLRSLQREVMNDLNFGEELSDQQLKDLIGKYLLEQEKGRNFTLLQRKQMGKEIFDSLRKMDVLQELLEDPDITEIMVNGYKHIFVGYFI